jgi:hypothetical protein
MCIDTSYLEYSNDAKVVAYYAKKIELQPCEQIFLRIT